MGIPPIARLPVPVPVLCSLFAGAVLLAGGVPTPPLGDWASIGLAAAAAGGTGIAASVLRRQRPPAVLLIVLAFGLGLLRAATAFQAQPEAWAGTTHERIEVLGIVDAAIQTRGSASFVEVAAERTLTTETISSGRVRLTLPVLPPLEFGDRVRVVGRFEPVDAGSSFGKDLLSRGIVATTAYPDVERLEPAAGLPSPWIPLQRVRAGLQRALQQALPEPQAGLMAGLLVGATGGMGEEMRQALIASGTSHLVVVSGYNITLVAGALEALSRGHHWLRAVVPFGGLWLFVLLAGAAPPSLRAALMASITLGAMRLGRGADPLGALALTVAAMLAVAPSLALELGFQLSALATLGLIALQSRVASLLGWLPRVAREPIAATLAAQLATLPVLASTFHQISAVAPLSNVLAAPMVPVATIAGAVGAVVAAVIPAATALVGLLLLIPSGYLAAVIEATAGLPHALVPIGDVPHAAMVLFAATLLAWAAIPTPEGRDFIAALRARPRLASVGLALPIGALVSVVAGAALGPRPALLSLSVFDTGGSTAYFLRSPGGQSILVDGGRSPAALANQLGRRLGPLERHLTLVLLTRADPERLPGSVMALERYPPSLALGPPESPASALSQRWQKAAASRALALNEPLVMDLEPGLHIEAFPTGPIAGPGDRGPQPTLVARIRYGDVAILLGPSMTARAAQALGREGWPLQASVLIVPRSGAADSLDAPLLAAIGPRLAILPVDGRPRAPPPAPETLALLEGLPAFRTDFHGAVEVTTDGSQIWVRPER